MSWLWLYWDLKKSQSQEFDFDLTLWLAEQVWGGVSKEGDKIYNDIGSISLFNLLNFFNQISNIKGTIIAAKVTQHDTPQYIILKYTAWKSQN